MIRLFEVLIASNKVDSALGLRRQIMAIDSCDVNALNYLTEMADNFITINEFEYIFSVKEIKPINVATDSRSDELITKAFGL